jgi:hypothetical protein
MDVHHFLEVTPEGIRWRDHEEFGGLTVEPVTVTMPFERDMTARDLEVLDDGFCSYDYVQVVFSRMEPRNDTLERDTYKTAHLPLEAVKQYLRGRYGRDKTV